MERTSIWNLIWTVIYTTVTVIFLIKLNRLNELLVTGGYDKHVFNLISYNDSQPLKYFGFTLLLVIIGGFLLYLLGHCLRYEHQLTLWDIISLIMAMLSVITLIVLLIIFIQIPIFRAILTIGFLGTLGIGALVNR